MQTRDFLLLMFQDAIEMMFVCFGSVDVDVGLSVGLSVREIFELALVILSYDRYVKCFQHGIFDATAVYSETFCTKVNPIGE